MGDKNWWESRYNTGELIHGEQPSEFLAENQELLPGRGLALDLAAGEGRNAVFLAELGLQVIALDVSHRALSKCRQLARRRGVSVETAVVDLQEFEIPAARFDLIINFNYLQRELAAAIVKALRPGGLVAFETLTREHLKWKPEFEPAFLLTGGELLRMFAGLHLLKYRETTLQSRGNKRSVAGIIARAGGA